MTVAQVFNLDSDGDVDFTGGKFNLAEDTEAVRLMVLSRLKMWIGEWFLDLESGVDYMGAVLNKSVVDMEMRTEILQAILNTPYVEEVTRLDIDIQSREASENNLKIDWEASTAFSTTINGNV